MTKEASEKQRAEFDEIAGLIPEPEPVNDPRLPAELQGKAPPPWWGKSQTAVDPGSWVASL